MEFLNQLEQKFDQWLSEFSQHPFKNGFKVLIAFIVLKWVYRNIIK
jgi:hypothetical protein